MVRLFVGGLAEDVTSPELLARFNAFGAVNSAEVLPPKPQDTCRDPSENACRGFGYVDIDFFNDSTQQRCLSVYNGSKWKGSILRVGLAKQRFQEKYEEEKQEYIKQQEEERLAEEESKNQAEDSSALLLAFSDKPLQLPTPDGKEIKTRPNKVKCIFPVGKQLPVTQLSWEELPEPPAISKKRNFEDVMSSVFDAQQARKDWIKNLHVPQKKLEPELRLEAVSFMDEEEVAKPLKAAQGLDLSRFSDDE